MVKATKAERELLSAIAQKRNVQAKPVVLCKLMQDGWVHVSLSGQLELTLKGILLNNLLQNLAR